MKIYKISKEFTDLPGGRYEKFGKFSGEEFREKVLIELLKDEKVIIDLDDVYGYPPSFLEEAFGGLVREYKYSYNELRRKLEFISKEQPELPEKIFNHIKNAKKEKK